MANRQHYAIRDNQIQEVPESEVDVEFLSPSRLVGTHGNVVPLSNNAQSARLFYAGRFLNQAMPIANREAPLVQSLDPESKEGKSFEEKYGERMGAKFADDDATVSAVSPDEIELTLANGEKKKYDLYNNFQFNRKTFLHSKPQVKVGDNVKKGQILASTNFTDDKGTMSMGVNARVALVPYKGYSMDDAIVVSESFAKRLASEHNYEFTTNKDGDMKYGKTHFSSLFPMKFTTKQLETLDDNGVVKPGTVLHKGDPVILATRPKPFSSNSKHLGKLSRQLRNMRADASEVWEHDYPGVVQDSVDGKKRYKVYASATVPAQVGDKIIGQRVGQKCYSSDTEILTEKRGWVLMKDLQEDDKVAALFDRNMDPAIRDEWFSKGYRSDTVPQELYAKFVKPLHIVSYPYEGTMYGLNTGHVSYLVTPNHRVWCSAHRKGAKYGAQDAWSMHGCARRFMSCVDFDLSGRVDPEYFEIPMVDKLVPGRINHEVRTKFPYRAFVKFLALYLAEGNVRHSNDVDYAIIITQKEREYCREIEALFAELGFEWKKYNNQYRITPNKALSVYLRQFGKANTKFIPEWVFQSSKEALQDFIDTIWQGDGDKYKGKHYWSSSLSLIHGVIRILLMLGKNPTWYRRDKRAHQNFDTYEINILDTDAAPGYTYQKKPAYFTQEYNDNVYCVQVPGLGVILTRRNGRAMWNGNSIISKILPDEHMLRSVDGKPFEVLLNPLALPSRVNNAAIYELALSKLAQAEGKPIKIANFNDPKKTRLNDVLERLQKAGISDTEEVFDPVTNKKLEKPVSAGLSYIYKLHHVVESKKSARGQGAYDVDFQPLKGGSEAAQAKRLGGLETTALLARGAYETLREGSTLRGQQCFDTHTEVLTRNGWKLWPNVTENDELLTKNKEEGGVAWYEHPVRIVSYNYTGEMFGYQGKHCDWLVTPDHNLWGFNCFCSRKKSYRKLKTFQAASIFGKDGSVETFGHVYPGTVAPGTVLHLQASSPKANSLDITIEDYCEFMGWWLSEGSCTIDKTGRGRVLISQNKVVNPEPWAAIEALFARLGLPTVIQKSTPASVKPDIYGIKASTPVGTPIGIRVCNRGLADHVKQYGSKPWNKRVPPIIFEAPVACREKFLRAFIAGDGCDCVLKPREHWRNGKLHRVKGSEHSYMSTSSIYLQDDLQRLASITGYAAFTGIAAYPGEGAYKRTHYRIIVSKNLTEASFYKKPAAKYLGHYKQYYDGPVYCATMRTGLLYVRRNGKCMWSGNCDEYWRLLRQGYRPADPGAPFVWDKFQALLNGAGLHARDIGKGKLRLSPLTDRDLEERKPVEVLNGKMVNPETLESVAGGLFSEELVGGDKWGKITLSKPLPNPAFEAQIQQLLGITNADMRKVLAGEMTLKEAQEKGKK